jgi:hypothetical protein
MEFLICLMLLFLFATLLWFWLLLVKHLFDQIGTIACFICLTCLLLYLKLLFCIWILTFWIVKELLLSFLLWIRLEHFSVVVGINFWFDLVVAFVLNLYKFIHGFLLGLMRFLLCCAFHLTLDIWTLLGRVWSLLSLSRPELARRS